METWKGLVDQFGRAIVKKQLLSEVAGPTVTGVRSPMTGYPGDGLNPVRLAHILREADEGDPLRYLELAETIEERDLHYLGVLGTRRRSVSQLDVSIEAASESALHVKQADMLRTWLQRDELADELFDMLDAIGKGFSFTEILWDTSEGQWLPKRLEYRDPRWFRFAREDGRTPLIRTDGGDIPLPPGKFITAVMRAKSGLPVRSGLARVVAWAWMFKAFTQRDWAIFTQTYGQPIRIGKYGPNADRSEKDTLFRAVANIAGDCAAIIPDSMVIEFIESKSVAASTDLYRVRSDWLDQQVSKAVLGQTATTDAIAGGHAVGREHRLVQEDIERADAKALSAILNRDLVRIWINLEFGPQQQYPRLKIGREEETDVKLVVDSIERLVPLGLKVPVKWMADLIGAPEARDGEAVLEKQEAPALPAVDKAAAKFPAKAKPALHSAEPEPPPLRADPVGAITRRAERLAGASLDAMIDRVRALANQADSLEDFRNKLAKLVDQDQPDPSQSDLADPGLVAALRQAIAFAELSGRSDIDDGE